jgi:hypothetical protein
LGGNRKEAKKESGSVKGQENVKYRKITKWKQRDGKKRRKINLSAWKILYNLACCFFFLS